MHLQLPRRVKEILEELGFIELQCYKPNPLMKQQPSLLFPRDEDKNTFLHLLGNVFQILTRLKLRYSGEKPDSCPTYFET